MEMPHSGWTCREMVEGNGPRGLSSSDLTNVSQANFGLTWVTFQEVPTTKIDFRCARKGIRTQKYLEEKLLPPH